MQNNFTSLLSSMVVKNKSIWFDRAYSVIQFILFGFDRIKIPACGHRKPEAFFSEFLYWYALWAVPRWRPGWSSSPEKRSGKLRSRSVAGHQRHRISSMRWLAGNERRSLKRRLRRMRPRPPTISCQAEMLQYLPWISPFFSIVTLFIVTAQYSIHFQ